MNLGARSDHPGQVGLNLKNLSVWSQAVLLDLIEGCRQDQTPYVGSGCKVPLCEDNIDLFYIFWSGHAATRNPIASMASFLST